MNIVIIGASFAGVSAAMELRSRDKQATITLLEKQPTLGYMPGSLHLYWEKKIDHLDTIRFITPKKLDQHAIHCQLGATVLALDTAGKKVTYSLLGKEEQIDYDKVIIAAGSRQLSEKIKGSENERVLKYKQYEEAQKAIDIVDRSQHITIIGGGHVGVEAADLLNRQQKQVTLIESMDYILFKYLDSDMTRPVQQKMLAEGIDLRLKQTVSAIDTALEEHLVLHLGEDTLKTEAAVMGVNVRPYLPFLDASIRLNSDQTIAVDQYLRTSVEDVFAAGDCIQLTGPEEDSRYLPLINNAVRSGMTAARNLISPVSPFKGSLKTIGTCVFGYYIASTGMTEADSLFTPRQVNSHRQTVQLNSLPDSDTVTLKWVYDAQTHELLGAQMVSTSNILEKINTLALAIQTRQTLDEIQQTDYFFHPSYSQLTSTTSLMPWNTEESEKNET
ncbi:NAD(P)/FAD-dependent oxidoreductase [Alkalibacterium sp. AK22]|uniref:NAD(P)/FAD-dependent oxidoreductase n=1 Tax=Alkalibacterium sp. AK22 TaxID=1229520 RepID=UPI00054DB3E0|nr:FAD/NAD(P)-binding oxidoreductase [Alkalibacterium sp. AK22]